MREWITQIRRGILELCLLNLLHAKESYGYEIVQSLQEIEELAVSESTVYPILSRLRKDGYLKVKTLPSSDGPPRRYFSLTRIGQTYLREMNDYWQDLIKSIESLKKTAKQEEIAK
jgi:PadR family transcriptional regulator, regulatory protein PadR